MLLELHTPCCNRKFTKDVSLVTTEFHFHRCPKCRRRYYIQFVPNDALQAKSYVASAHEITWNICGHHTDIGATEEDKRDRLHDTQKTREEQGNVSVAI